MRLFSVCLLVLALWPVRIAVAQEQEWWFDIEVIVFERSHDESLAEQFDNVAPIPSNWQLNLIEQALTPDISGLLPLLNTCTTTDTLPTIDSILAEYQAHQARLREAELIANPDLDNNSDAVDSLAVDDAITAIIEDASDNFTQVSSPTEVTPVENDPANTEENAARSDDLNTQQGPEISLSAENALLSDVNAQDSPFDYATQLRELNQQRQALIESLPALEPIKLPVNVLCIMDNEMLLAGDTPLYAFDISLPRIERVPTTLSGLNWFRAEDAHLLPDELFSLHDFARGINRLANHRVLLHTAWRQEVEFGRDIADSIRLIAGKDLHAPLYEAAQQAAKLAELESENEGLNERSEAVGESFDSMDNLTTSERLDESSLAANDELDPPPNPTNTFFTQLDKALNTPVPADIVQQLLSSDDPSSEPLTQYQDSRWQVDGTFKVYLQYINRVPYLHIDNELVYQRPVKVVEQSAGPAFEAIGLKQLRRVISQQVHYFDHPLFGVIVQIRRHDRPEPDALSELNEVDTE